MKPASTVNAELVRGLEFELAYLSLLTLEGLKPLSRWEKRFNDSTHETLLELGLRTRVVERRVQTGRCGSELADEVRGERVSGAGRQGLGN